MDTETIDNSNKHEEGCRPPVEPNSNLFPAQSRKYQSRGKKTETRSGLKRTIRQSAGKAWKQTVKLES